MAMRDLLSAVTSDLRSPEHARQFQEMRQRYESLTPYENVPALLEAIDATPVRRYALDETVLCPLIAEHQLRPNALCSGLLLVLCGPMLTWLRASIRGDVLDDDDLDQLVTSTFLETVRSIPLARVGPRRTFAALRTLTRRGVFERVGREQAGRSETELMDPHDLVDLLDGETDSVEELWTPSPCPAPTGEERAREVAAQTAFLLQHGADVLDEERLELVVHTHILGGQLIEYVEERHPDVSPAARGRIYQREKRRHARAVRVLRDALAPLRRLQVGGADSTEPNRDIGGARRVG